MSIFKKAAAAATAVMLAASCTACGYNTRSALTVDGYSVPAGIYIYFMNNAYNEAISKLTKENADLDTTDEKAVKALPLEGKDVTTWIQDRATEMCVDFAATEKKFDELGLTLTDEDKNYVEMMMSYYWNADSMEPMGVSEDSFKKVVTSTYKSQAVFDHYYGIGEGELGVTEEEVTDYYADEHIRAQFVRMSLTDANGEMLKADGKKALKDMAEDYSDRVEDALKDGGVDAVMAEMDAIQKDYDAYVEEQTAAATAATEDAAADEDADTEGEEHSGSVTVNAEAVEDETTEETTEETAEDTAEAETAAEEETTEAESEAEDAEDETDADAEDETAEASDEDGEEETDETAEDDTDEESAEDDAPLLTTGADETDEEATPFPNESIISVIHEEDYDDPNDIYYDPSQSVYEKLLAIGEADYGKPYIVEEDDYYTLVVRYDIRDRMTDDDLLTEGTLESTNYTMHQKDYEDLMDTWTDVMTVVRNDAAYRRYDPFKFKFA